jgi:hypothetical protein
MNKLIITINHIVSHSTELKNRYTDAFTAPIEFACIFCQNEDEYREFTTLIEKLGKSVEETHSGFTYLLKEPLKTIAGPLRLVKIRTPDPNHSERGDADFNTDYKNFKDKYEKSPKFELVKKETFEMLRLSSPKFDVMACFSNIPKSKDLGIKL